MHPAYIQLVAKCSSPSICNARATGCATSTVRPNVWVLFVLQFLASETAMIGRQYQISPEFNKNLWSMHQNEIFTFHFLSDRDMGNCNVGWSIRSHPSLYELSRSFFQSIGIGIEKFWSWCESENISDIVQSRFVGRRWNAKLKNWRKKTCIEPEQQSSWSSWREWDVESTLLISLSVMFFTGIYKVDQFSWITQASSFMF